jgi:hypothetical protein
MPRPLTWCSISCFVLIAAEWSSAAPPDEKRDPHSADARQADLESALVEMLRGATLEGTYTNTAVGRDRTKLLRDRYTLGDVRKLRGNFWLIEARIQYDDHDVTLPITVPIHWAGDTPMIVVDNQRLPPFGTVSARVMFFDGHYAGYWKHGEQRGHLFGEIKRGNHDNASQRDAQ